MEGAAKPFEVTAYGFVPGAAGLRFSWLNGTAIERDQGVARGLSAPKSAKKVKEMG